MSSATLHDVERWLDEFLWADGEPRQRAKRLRILAAATECFVEFGYRKTSMDEVAIRAGVAKGTLYLYYRNKAELVFHAIALEKSRYLDRLGPLTDTTVDARLRLRTLIAMGLVLSAEMPLLARVTRGDHEIGLAIADLDTSVLARINDWQTEFMVDLLDQGTRGRLPRAVLVERAQVLIDLIYAVTTSGHLLAAPPSVEAHARVLAGIVADGVLDTAHEQDDLALPAGQSRWAGPVSAQGVIR